MLHPPSQRRERILLFGPSGAGKSTAWATIAEWIHKTHSTSQMYVMDTDNAWDAMHPFDGHLDPIVTVFDCPEWDDTREAVKKLRSIDPTRDDWLILDMADKPWSQAQEGYFSKAFGVEIDEFFVQVHGDATKLGGDWGVNWVAVNKMYSTVSTLLQSRWPGHVLACAPAKTLWKDTKADLIIAHPEFGKIGYIPQGQKDLPHIFHTILYMQQAPSGWKVSTAKERNPAGLSLGDDGYRPYLEGEDVKDFVKTYLMKVGGWRP